MSDTNTKADPDGPMYTEDAPPPEANDEAEVSLATAMFGDDVDDDDPDPDAEPLELLDGDIERIAEAAHNINRAYRLAIGQDAGPTWAEHEGQAGVMAGVEAVLADPDVTPRAMHSKWASSKMADGWAYGAELDRANRTHPNLIDFDLLPEPERVKDALFIAAVRAAKELLS